ncbi:MAG: ATP-binding protein [Mariprofundaceae bacterium]|nr:ATP-binding protein [Mariprofundaceae bacterium]
MPQDVLESIVSNLLENAKQAGCQHIHLQLEKKTRCILLHVEDDGCGIDELNLKNIFTPFFTTKRQEGGTGLGLSINQSLLRKYGGAIVYSDLKKGMYATRFTLTFPYEEISDAEKEVSLKDRLDN